MESQQVLVDVPAAAAASERTEKISLFALTAMMVGSMVGAGIFSLPRAFATATGPFGAIIAWTIAAGGMYMLARVLQALAERKPDLDAGVYAYAKAGFGDYLGFPFGAWLILSAPASEIPFTGF
jgi:arginine:ornithine antiporter/lysine permease